MAAIWLESTVTWPKTKFEYMDASIKAKKYNLIVHNQKSLVIYLSSNDAPEWADNIIYQIAQPPKSHSRLGFRPLKPRDIILVPVL